MELIQLNCTDTVEMKLILWNRWWISNPEWLPRLYVEDKHSGVGFMSSSE